MAAGKSRTDGRNSTRWPVLFLLIPISTSFVPTGTVSTMVLHPSVLLLVVLVKSRLTSQRSEFFHGHSCHLSRRRRISLYFSPLRILPLVQQTRPRSGCPFARVSIDYLVKQRCCFLVKKVSSHCSATVLMLVSSNLHAHLSTFILPSIRQERAPSC